MTYEYEQFFLSLNIFLEILVRYFNQLFMTAKDEGNIVNYAIKLMQCKGLRQEEATSSYNINRSMRYIYNSCNAIAFEIEIYL